MSRYRSGWVTGGGGIRLRVEETGDPGRDLRLVALDVRGHGLSDKPRDAYGDPALWAADLLAVIEALDLERPILCGWSYGGVVIGDYLQAHGEATAGPPRPRAR